MNGNFFGKVKDFMTKGKTIDVIRYGLGGIFTLFALFNGLHFSSLFMLVGAFLMMPFPFMRSALNKWNIKPVFAVILSALLVFVGLFTSPALKEDDEYIPADLASLIEDQKESEKSTSNDKTEENPDKSDENGDESKRNSIENQDPADDFGYPEETPDEPVQGEGSDLSEGDSESKTETVWISATGSKYHSKPDCSGMKNPKEISLEEAENKDLEPCKRCH